MKISINRANKLRNSLEGLTFPLVLVIAVSTSSAVDEAKATVSEAEASVLESVNNCVLKLQYTKVLRDAIFEANVVFGIVPIISEIANIDARIKSLSTTLSTIVGYGNRASSLKDFEERKAYRDQIEKTPEGLVRAGPRENVTIGVGGPAREHLEAELKRLKLLLNDKQEERNRKNHENYIELPADMVEFLKVHALM